MRSPVTRMSPLYIVGMAPSDDFFLKKSDVWLGSLPYLWRSGQEPNRHHLKVQRDAASHRQAS